MAFVFAAPANAQPVSEAPDAVAVTIYREGGSGGASIAMITETRTIDVPAGQARISFRGVADGLVPQTVAIEGLPGTMLERNQDYDLLTPGALIARSIDKPVRIVRTNPVTGKTTEQTAIVRSGPQGVMLEIDGKLEALRCSGLPEQMLFDEVPAGLADRPTLSVLTRTGTAGRHKVRLSYLATGLTWKADYVARIRPDGRTLDLTGWITLTNSGATSFVDAPTQVVAGELQRNNETRPPYIERIVTAARCWPFHDGYSGGGAVGGGVAVAGMPPPPPSPPPMMAAVEDIVVTAQRVAVQSELGDYKLYSLPDPTTVAAQQTKQVLMLQQEAVPFERVYQLRVDADGPPADRPATALLRLKNTTAQGLGKPLPAGVVAVMDTSASGRPVLIGEEKVRDVAVGLPLEIELGRAMDIVTRSRVVTRTGSPSRPRATIEVEVANRKSVPVVLEVRQPGGGQRGFRIFQESARHRMEAGDPIWTLRLAAGERAILTYGVETR
ncbi:MAG: hypothetical protein V4466_17185 [Pseudomonadota bacterium]